MPSALDDVDRYLIPKEFGVEFAHIFIKHVKELSRKLYPCWATAADYERQEPSSLFIGSGGKACSFQVSNYFVPDQLRVGDVFEKVAVL